MVYFLESIKYFHNIMIIYNELHYKYFNLYYKIL